MKELKAFLVKNNIDYQENISLKKKTWIKQGGFCSFWITPFSTEELKLLGSYLYKNKLGFEVVGQTSNLYFKNSYNPLIIISTLKVIDYYYIGDNDEIVCGCGMNVSKLARMSVQQGYLGFYGLVGLPGTIGGAIYNNSSCFDCNLSSMLISVNYLSSIDGLVTLSKDELGFNHRSSILKQREKEGIILSVKLKIDKTSDKESEIKKSDYVQQKRKLTQEGPLNNLGSIYSNRKMKYNLKNILAKKIVNLLFKLSIINSSTRILYLKKLFLFFYGYNYLDKYISDKNINTFIWKDENSESAFEDYKCFMKCVFSDLELEIEEKS